jgi:hypothetical protein
MKQPNITDLVNPSKLGAMRQVNQREFLINLSMKSRIREKLFCRPTMQIDGKNVGGRGYGRSRSPELRVLPLDNRQRNKKRDAVGASRRV